MIQVFTKITDEDLAGKGVVGQPAVPGLSVKEMQESVEQIVREVAIPAINRLIEELADAPAAQSIGAQNPLSGNEKAALQTVLNAILNAAQQHASNKENPHAVTAGQTGAYTKSETDGRIDEKVVEIGAGDMARAVYDPENKRRPYIPFEEALDKSTYKGSEDGVVKSADKLRAPVKIGSADFDGSASITLSSMGAEPEFEKNSAFNKDFGNAAGTVCEGDDSRLSNARRASNITMTLSGTTLRVTYT